jgi:hypothetical protein
LASSGQTTKYVYKIDSKGNRVETTMFINDKFNMRWEAKYDEKGNEISSISYRENGTVYMKKASTYDANGNCTAEILSNPDGTVSQKDVYQYVYDAVGNWTKKTDLKNDVPVFMNVRTIEYFKP